MFNYSSNIRRHENCSLTVLCLYDLYQCVLHERGWEKIRKQLLSVIIMSGRLRGSDIHRNVKKNNTIWTMKIHIIVSPHIFYTCWTDSTNLLMRPRGELIWSVWVLLSRQRPSESASGQCPQFNPPPPVLHMSCCQPTLAIPAPAQLTKKERTRLSWAGVVFKRIGTIKV